ncbi:MAG: hypothetical protein R3F30_01665 [Planctomycetota bacterium]
MVRAQELVRRQRRRRSRLAVDENRKFNVPTLIAEDEDFRELSRQRLVRLLDHLWEDTDHDLGGSDAETWANLIQELLKGVGWSDDRPRPTLRSNKEGDPRTMIPTLDFLKLIPQIPEEVFEDRFVENGVFLPGLRSVLTVHTALSSGSATTTTTQSTSSNEPDQGGGGGEQGPGGTQTPESEPQMLEPGIRINVNTASRAVLSCLESEQDVPPLVIDAILKWRNEEDEEARQKAEEAQASGDEAALLAGEEGQSFRKIFRTLDDLDELPEWKNLADSEGKNRFLSMLTTKSHVFTVHLAGIHKRGQGGKAFSIMRQRGVYVRLEGEDGAKMQVLVPMHRVTAIRVSRPDFPEQDEYVEGDIDLQALDDPFRAEERVWNPFFLEFYDPKRRAAVLEAR